MRKEDIKILLNKDNPIIIEIGSNDGQDSEEFLKVFDKCQLYCFEPDPRAIKKFKKRMLNYSNCKLYEIAVSNNNEHVDLYLSSGNHPDVPGYGDWDQSSSIKKPKLHLYFHVWCSFDNSIKVESKKLDDWRNEEKIENVDFIWADIQGAEKELIEGAVETLKNTRYLYTEFDNVELYEGQPNLDQILEMLPDFKIIKIVENNVLLKNTTIIY